MNKKFFWLNGLLVFLTLFIGKGVLADTVQVSTVDDLITQVNTATQARTITLDSNFPQTISKTIDLKENTSYPIIIDGQNKTFTSDGSTLMFSYSGGSSSTAGSVTLKNMILQGNNSSGKAINTSGYKGDFNLDNVYVGDFHNPSDGGAMNIGGNTSIVDSTFENNTTNAPGYGGGAIAGKQFSSKLVVENSKFFNNETLALGTGAVGGEGGAMWFYAPSTSASFEFKNNYFKENKAVENASSMTGVQTLADGGAIAFFNVMQGIKIDFDSNTFDSNVAGDNGGAILIQANGSTSTDGVTSGILFQNNTFYDNKSNGSASSGVTQSGGAIQIYQNGGRSTSRKTMVDFISNTFAANKSVTSGGAIGFAGAPFFNGAGGNFTNNILVDNVNGYSTGTETLNSIASSSVKSTDKGNNIGYDATGATGDIVKDGKQVFGNIPYGLVPDNSTISAGSSNTRETVPTIPIAPELLADAKVKDGTSLPVDQRNIPRIEPSDIGSVEISWLKYDSNGGKFNFDNLPDKYDGSTYYGEKQPTTYYQVGNNTQKVNIINGQSDLNASRENYDFLGWSTDPSATKPDDNLKAGNQTTIVSEGATLYAVWTPAAGASVTAHYVDEQGKTISEDIILTGPIGESYTTTQQEVFGYKFKEVVGNTTGTFTNESQEVTYIYSEIVPGKITVEYWEYDVNGNPIKKIHADETITGKYGERYDAPIIYVPEYGFNGVITDDGFAPLSGLLLNEEAQTIKLSYHLLTDDNPLQEGVVVVQYQDSEGKTLRENEILRGAIGSDYAATQLNIDNYTMIEVVGEPTGQYTSNVKVVTFVYKSNSIPKDELIPVYRAYNSNDGDHLFTTSKKEYDWIQTYKWTPEGIAFQSVVPTHKSATKVYRLYNPNSGEHFYTTDVTEYNSVGAAGWKQEGIGFYMVTKEEGDPVYRVFNPNATGPGSHMYTKVRSEADWLISLGWRDEGIAFYTPR
ncbi:MucBP domain-containing protein [Enterococcus alishanensis]